MADKYESVVQVDIDHVNNGNVTCTELVDTGPTTQSFCQRSWKFFLACSVVCSVGLVIYIIVKSSTDDCETIPFTNNTNNPYTGNYEDEQYKGACIYRTPTEFLKKLEKDPFGDLCRRDSPTCQGHSTHACKRCGDENVKFPSFCFCDIKGHCNMDGKRSFDSQQKSNCSDCLVNFHMSPFSARGTCSCRQKLLRSLQCDCHASFTGFMCSSIRSRYCTPTDNPTDNEPQISHCKDSNEERCHLNQNGKYYVCKPFEDSHSKGRKSASSCEIIVTP